MLPRGSTIELTRPSSSSPYVVLFPSGLVTLATCPVAK
jgi:hypothetical protein